MRTTSSWLAGLVLATVLGACGAASTGPAVPAAPEQPAADTITVAVMPSAVTVEPGSRTVLSANVTGTVNTAVVWSVQESAGGSVTSAGVYTAPGSPGVFHVVATSQVDATKSSVAEIAVTASAAPPPVTTAANVYASPAGGGDGSSSSSPTTIDAAVGLARAAKASSSNGVTVWLLPGTYLRSAALTLGSTDSGAAGKPVVYRSYDVTQRAVVTGGVRATGWQQLTSGNAAAGIWSRINASAQGRMYFASVAGLSPGTLTHRADAYGSIVPPNGGPVAELVYDGAVQQLGRWPNRNPASRSSEYEPIVSTNGTTSVGTSTSRPSAWSAAVGLSAANKPFLGMYEFDGWAFGFRQVTTISGSVIDTAGGAAPMGIRTGQQWFGTNLLEEVDAPGEYWIDRDALVVYFYGPGGTAPVGEALVSSIPTVLSVNGASYVTFQDIIFGEAQQDLVVTSSTSNHVTFQGCTFRNAGGNVVMLDGSANVVDHGAIYGAGDSTVVMRGTGQTISNVDIHDWGRYTYAYAGGINVGGGSHVIRNNAIHDGPWAAVYLPGGDGTLIEFNEIYATNLHGNDAGAIYLFHTGNGVEIRYNFIHDIPQATGITSSPADIGIIGLYFDDGANGIYAHGNLLYRVGAAATTTASGGAASKSIAVESKNANVVLNNMIVKADKALEEYWPAGATPPTVWTNNQVWPTTTLWWSPNTNTSYFADPGFLNEASGDLATNPTTGDIESPAFSANGTYRSATTGKEVIPFRRIGIR